jgi:hypothetical protein
MALPASRGQAGAPKRSAFNALMRRRPMDCNIMPAPVGINYQQAVNMHETYTRQQLHGPVWSGPMKDVSRKFGLSDNGLRKHCVKAFVPLPPQGYWNKLHAGQRPKVIPLPPRPPGVSDTITFGTWDYRENEKRLLETEPVAPTFAEPIEALRERVGHKLGVVVASKNLSPPHAAFRRQVEDDARRAAQSSWHTSIFDRALEKRRLRILQGLFYGLSRLDCSAVVQGREVRTIYISVGQQTVQITLDRITTRHRGVTSATEEDRLKFSIAGGRFPNGERISWQDSDEQPLEKQLSTIAVEIVVAGEMQYREHQVSFYEEAVRRREEMRQAAIKRKLEQEKAERDRVLKLEEDRLKRLVDSAENHRRANDIRGFVASVIANPAPTAGEDRVGRWQAWALAQADRIDPITTGRIWDDVSEEE